jgi:hypothetical protein
VRHHQDQKWANQNAQQQQAYSQQQAAAQQQMYDAQQQAYQQGLADAQAQQQYAPPPPPAPAPAPAAAPANDLNSQLMQLAQLHNAGVLTDEEFAAAKAKLLAG